MRLTASREVRTIPCFGRTAEWYEAQRKAGRLAEGKGGGAMYQKILRMMIWLVVSGALPSASLAQTGKTGFAPVEAWRTAVLSGDSGALAALYSANPQLTGPGDKPMSVVEEVGYWTGWKQKGLEQLRAEIVETQEPQPGVRVLLLEITLTARAGGSAKKSYLAMAQGWRREGESWRIVLVKRREATPLPQPIEKREIYPANVDANEEIAAALKAAAKTGKRVLLDFGGNWCYDCHVLDEAFHTPEIAPILDRNFVVVHVDVGEFNKNLDVAKKYDVPLEKGVPAMAVLESNGTTLFSQKKGEFEKARSLAPEDILAFLNKWKPARHP
jgi:thioredoxin-related protein